MTEATLLEDKHILACLDVDEDDELMMTKLDAIKKRFCGKVISEDGVMWFPDDPFRFESCRDSWIYLCGDIERNLYTIDLSMNDVNIVREVSHAYDQLEDLKVPFVSSANLPTNVHGLGVYFPRLFDDDHDYFEDLTRAHNFQNLTESNKVGSSYRTGLYLTDVRQTDQDVEFNLLRCSTNFQGPTENFKDIDRDLVQRLNVLNYAFFDEPAPLNHVLAQVYENPTIDGKERKAKIKSHSDKTKDMPTNGVIAFCTFYSKDIYDIATRSKLDENDLVYKNASVLTQLRFKLKKSVKERTGLQESFTIKLYPNSAFFIPLSTNRRYTHEIVPPTLPVDKIPTRLGYVARCSKTKATHRDGATFLGDVALKAPSDEERVSLADLYYKENTTDAVVDYGDIFYSLNDGDYMRPIA